MTSPVGTGFGLLMKFVGGEICASDFPDCVVYERSVCVPSAPRLLRLCGGLHIEQALQEVELQDPRDHDEDAGTRRPPVHVVVVGHQSVVIGASSHAGESIITPHVQNTTQHHLRARLKETNGSQESVQRGGLHKKGDFYR